MRARVLALALATIAALTIFGSTGASAQGSSAVCGAGRRQRMRWRESAAVQTGRPRRLWLGDPHFSEYGPHPSLLRHRCRQSSQGHRRTYSPRPAGINGGIVVTLFPRTLPRGQPRRFCPAALPQERRCWPAIRANPVQFLHQRAQRRVSRRRHPRPAVLNRRRFASAVTAQSAVTAASIPARTNQEPW